MTPIGILTADLHLRDDQPICRTDNFFETQARKLRWLYDLQQKHGCPIFDAGDLFNKGRPSHFLMQWAIDARMPEDFFTIPGNHDLPSHNIELLDSSGLGVLSAARAVDVLIGEYSFEKTGVFVHAFPWGEKPTPLQEPREEKHLVAICHIMTYHGTRPWPGCTDPSAEELLEQMQGYNLVLTGHNHKTFVVEKDGRLLVNPGSFTRQKSDQTDHRPCVFLWYGGTNIEQEFVPIEESIITREHINTVEAREERMSAFVEKLTGEMEIGLSFEQNVEEFFSKNKVRKPVKDMVWEALK